MLYCVAIVCGLNYMNKWIHAATFEYHIAVNRAVTGDVAKCPDSLFGYLSVVRAK